MSRQLQTAIYYEFVRFIATPYPFRLLKTQEEFQERFNVSHTTLANYKRLPNFWPDVAREFEQWAKENTPNVMSAVMIKAIKQGDPKCAELWLRYIEKFEPREARQQGVEPDLDNAQISDEKRTQILSAFGNFGVLKAAEIPKQKSEASN